VAGLLFALARVGGFAASSPIMTRTFPPIGRVAFALAVSLAVVQPVDALPGAMGMIGSTLANVALGVVLGFATGLILYLFEVAGSLIDLTSGLAMATVLDPTTRAEAGPFLGLPVKMMMGFAVAGAVIALLPGSVHGALEAVTSGLLLDPRDTAES
jgi:flagellar biosynthesis protein FliR